MNERDTILNDDLLKKAFNDYFERTLAILPSDEELAARYPYPESSLKIARRIYKRHRRKTPVWLRYLGRAAVILFAVVSLTFGLLLTDSNVRAAVSNFFMRDRGDHVEIDFNNGEELVLEDERSDTTEMKPIEFEIRYIPDGFELTEDNGTDKKKAYKYESSGGDWITIEICKKEDVEDKEYRTYKNMRAGTRIGYYTALDDGRINSIFVGHVNYVIRVATTLDVETLQEIAANVREVIDLKSEKYKDCPANKFKIGYIPERYELHTDIITPFYLIFVYYTDEGIPLSIGISEKKHSFFGIDNERTTYSAITVNGQEAQLWYNYEDGNGKVLVVYGEYVVDVYAQCSVEELLKIAENIKPIADV